MVVRVIVSSVCVAIAGIGILGGSEVVGGLCLGLLVEVFNLGFAKDAE